MAGAAAVVESQETPQDEDAVFAAAFDQLSAANDAVKTGSDAPAVVEPPKPAEPPASKEDKLQPGEVLADPTKPAPTGGTPAPTGGTPAPTGGAPPPTGGTPTPQPQRMSDEDIARVAAIAAQVQRPQQRQEPQPGPQEVQIFSPEEVEFLNDYHAEYGDIARGEALLRRKDILDAVKFVFSEVNRVVKPIEAVALQLNARTHLGDLQRLIPESPLNREEAIQWARQQPDFLQPGYFHVIQNGTAEQVAMMTKQVRASQAVVTPAVANEASVADAAQHQTPAVQTDPAAKKALAALRPVDTKRSGITVDAIEPSDFDGAWERFAAAADAARK